MTDPADDLAPPAPLPLRRAMIVDDDPLARTLVGASFTDLGFDVTTAADGDEALALAAATRFDCVVLDVPLPGPAGFVFCRPLRRLPASLCPPPLILAVLPLRSLLP